MRVVGLFFLFAGAYVLYELFAKGQHISSIISAVSTKAKGG